MLNQYGLEKSTLNISDFRNTDKLLIFTYGIMRFLFSLCKSIRLIISRAYINVLR